MIEFFLTGAVNEACTVNTSCVTFSNWYFHLHSLVSRADFFYHLDFFHVDCSPLILQYIHVYCFLYFPGKSSLVNH